MSTLTKRNSIGDTTYVPCTIVMLVVQVIGGIVWLDPELGKDLVVNSVIVAAVCKSLFDLAMLLVFVGTVQLVLQPHKQGLLNTEHVWIYAVFPLFTAMSTIILKCSARLGFVNYSNY